jgi:hypothetical protein
MRFTTAVVSGVLFLALPLLAAAASCQTTTLDTYIALGSSGCTVGQFSFTGFSFGVMGSSGGPAPVAASAIMVTPFQSGNEYGLTYSSNGFNVSTGQKIQYLLSYVVGDPPIIHGFATSMRTDPPMFPGIATITSDECLGANFSGSTCPDPTASETVFSNGLISVLDASQSFGPEGLIGDQTTITLDATSGGSAEFISLSEGVLVPEPGTVVPVLLAVTVLLWLRMRRFQFAFKA